MKSKSQKRKEALARARKSEWVSSKAYRRWVEGKAGGITEDVARQQWEEQRNAHIEHLETLV